MSLQTEQLFSPLKVGPMTVKNRIVFLPHRARFGEAGASTGAPGEAHIAYWGERAKHGVGWIATQAEAVHVDPKQDGFNQLDSLARFKKVAKAIHDLGACVTAELFAYGPGISGHANDIVESPTPWGPSAVSGSRFAPMPHAVTLDEINQMIAAYVRAARMLQDAGYDGAEIHAANGHFLNSFLSPLTNRRTDQYGGSVDNRLRIVVEIREAIRRSVGKSFVLGARISGDEFADGGYTLEDMVEMAPVLAKGLDYLSVGGAGSYHSHYLIMPSMYCPLGCLVYCAAAIKKVVDIPVICAGRINDPVQAEDILTNGQADLVGMCRELIADPEWAEKAQSGRVDDIRKCLACNEGCLGRSRSVRPMTCVMNPVVGQESDWATIVPAAKRKRVMIVGGGPAGLEAARVAALRGHRVSLYDMQSELGGMTVVASKAPGRDDLAQLGRYYSRQLNILGVNVNLNTEVNANLVSQTKPDVLVMATGSIPVGIYAQGSDQSNVVPVRDVLMGREVGDKVVVIDQEYGMQALSAADYLASRGKKVEVITDNYAPGLKIDNNLTDNIRYPLFQRLYKSGVTFTPGTVVRQIRDHTIVVANRFTGEEHQIEGIDNVVYCCGDRENNALYLQVKDNVKEVYRIGDCAGVRKLVQATYEGAKVGREL